MNRASLVFAAWSFMAGAGIPLIGVLNSGMARTVGNPFSATFIMFAVASVVALGLAIPIYGVEGFEKIASAPSASWAAGLLIGFYALSATIIIPRFGAGNFIVFILIAQLATSTLIDQFGLFGLAKRPADLLKIAGLVVILAGVTLVQIASQRAAKA